MSSPSQTAITDWLSVYPPLIRLGLPEVGHVTPISFDQPMQYSVRLTWMTGRLSFEERKDLVMRLVGADLNYRTEHLVNGALSPAIGGNAELIHPLITWWIILYSFSRLARSNARTWASLIDFEESADAITIGRILDVARIDVPFRLVLAFEST